MKQYKRNSTVLFGILVASVIFCAAPVRATNPLLANYYLNELPSAAAQLEALAEYDLLILSASQIKAHPERIRQIHTYNSDAIILAYVPSQSYNEQYWPRDALFRSFRVSDDWWMRDTNGNIISHWPGLLHTNGSSAWNTYLSQFVAEQILTLPFVDGVFLDMVSDSISWLNNGNVDIDANGIRDAAATLDEVWRSRTVDLLQKMRQVIGSNRLLLINGASTERYQPYINGRMFETFPTPWEQDGSWSTIIRTAEQLHETNTRPLLHVFNRNTENTGSYRDYASMRFGLTSSLLIDGVYYSFDFGDTNHGQTWLYDEYNIDLGDAIADPISPTGQTNYSSGVWRRDFANGISVVNSSNQQKSISLGGEFEKITGTQDPYANDGAIVSSLTVPAQDGRILLKTTETLDNVFFTNGDFVRFLRADGTRVRNGFFVFDEAERGGTQIGRIDLNNNGKPEIITITGPKLEIYRDDGALYMKKYPYTASYTGDIRIAVGDLDRNGFKSVFVAPSPGYALPIRVYARHGQQIKLDWYPFGESYSGGYSLAIGRFKSLLRNHLVIGGGEGSRPYVNVYNWRYEKQLDWYAYDTSFTGGVFVATGDVTGDGIDEIITGPGDGIGPYIKVFDEKGMLLNEFFAYNSLLKEGISVRTADVDFDGVEDILGFSSGVGL